MINHIYIFLLLLLAVSCAGKKNQNSSLKHEKFSFDLPSGCSREKSEYLDSEYGEIRCEDFLIAYDYGYCNYSSSEALSKKDFFKQNRWLTQVIPNVVPKGKEVSLDTIFNKIKVLQVKEDELSALVIFENDTFEHKIAIPSHLNDLIEKTDTSNGVITRLIYDKKVMKGIDYYKINTSKSNSDNTCYESLIVRVSSESPLDSIVVFNFLNSVKFPIAEKDN